MTRALRFASGVAPGVYRHYKGNLYEVLGTVRHSETLEELVLYKALYKNYISLHDRFGAEKETVMKTLRELKCK